MSIVVGYTPTPEGRAALRRAADECALRKVRLVVVNSQYGGQSYDGDESSRFDAELEDVRRRVENLGVEVEVRILVRGNGPAEDIIGIADELGAEFVVIGLRRRTAVGKLVLGSNSQKVLLGANCPVIAVKATRES